MKFWCSKNFAQLICRATGHGEIAKSHHDFVSGSNDWRNNHRFIRIRGSFLPWDKQNERLVETIVVYVDPDELFWHINRGFQFLQRIRIVIVLDMVFFQGDQQLAGVVYGHGLFGPMIALNPAVSHEPDRLVSHSTERDGGTAS